MANGNGLYYSRQAMLDEEIIGDARWQEQYLRVTWRGLKAHPVFSILHHYPFAQAIGEMLADTLDPRSLDAQMHQLLRQFGGFALNLTPEIDDKCDHLALYLFKQGGGWQ